MGFQTPPPASRHCRSQTRRPGYKPLAFPPSPLKAPQPVWTSTQTLTPASFCGEGRGFSVNDRDVIKRCQLAASRAYKKAGVSRPLRLHLVARFFFLGAWPQALPEGRSQQRSGKANRE